MNALDIIICVIGGFCLVRGIFRGIIKEMTSIVGVFAGFFAAYTYYPFLAKLLSRLISDKPYLDIISFFLVFVIVFLAVGFLGVILKQLFKAVLWGWADRILGGAFATVKALLIVSVLLVALTAFLPKNSPVMRNSVLVPHVSTVSEVFAAVVPMEMKKKFHNNIKTLRDSWKRL